MKNINSSLWAKIMCKIRGHLWSRWNLNKKTGEQSRFCKRACGVSRETRTVLRSVDGPNYQSNEVTK